MKHSQTLSQVSNTEINLPTEFMVLYRMSESETQFETFISVKDLVTLGNHFKSIKDWNECALWLDTALRTWSELHPNELNHSIMFSAQECFTNIGQYGYARYLGRFISYVY